MADSVVEAGADGAFRVQLAATPGGSVEVVFALLGPDGVEGAGGPITVTLITPPRLVRLSPVCVRTGWRAVKRCPRASLGAPPVHSNLRWVDRIDHAVCRWTIDAGTDIFICSDHRNSVCLR